MAYMWNGTEMGQRKWKENSSTGNYDGYWIYYDYTGRIIGEAIFNNGNGKQKPITITVS